jgi:hypothetical protein
VEKMAHMQYLTTLATQTTDDRTKKLIEAIQLLWSGAISLKRDRIWTESIGRRGRQLFVRRMQRRKRSNKKERIIEAAIERS